MSKSMHGRVKTVLALQLLLLFYSLAGVLSKFAADSDFLSIEFLGLYIGILAILGAYAIGWQQILKRLPLTTAYSNRAVTVAWGILWGLLFFSEPVTIGKAAGAAMIIAGIVLYSHADGNDGTIAPATTGLDHADDTQGGKQ